MRTVMKRVLFLAALVVAFSSLSVGAARAQSITHSLSLTVTAGGSGSYTVLFGDSASFSPTSWLGRLDVDLVLYFSKLDGTQIGLQIFDTVSNPSSPNTFVSLTSGSLYASQTDVATSQDITSNFSQVFYNAYGYYPAPGPYRVQFVVQGRGKMKQYPNSTPYNKTTIKYGPVYTFQYIQ